MMKAVVLTAPGKFSIQELPMPVPQSGEVLVRIESSPINPSDGAFLLGLYSTEKTFPCVPGFEASGTVISSGGGLLGWRLVGKKVAVVSDKGQGVWAQFTVAPAKSCVPLPENIPFNLGCCFFVNPLTVIMFMEKIKEQKHRAVIQTAACSALGKMLLKYCMHERVPIVNIVRRSEQVETLRQMGAEFVLNSSDQNFERELKEISAKLDATAAFECVSGDTTGKVLNAMPEGSTLYLYGAMSMSAAEGINPSGIIFGRKSLQGLWLTNWVKKQGLWKLYKATNKVIELLPTILKSEVSREFPMENLDEALEFYKANMSAGKVILKPHLLEGKTGN
jgi:NADPH:quinone reductase-like Zn-dependent oxidoreductase